MARPQYIRPCALAVLALLLACVAQIRPTHAWGGLLPKRAANIWSTAIARRPHSHSPEADGSERRWQEEAVERAAGAGNSTAGLQLLVRAAAQRQQEQGQQPAVLMTIADDEGVAALLPLFEETLAGVAPSLAATAIVIAVSRPAFEACLQRHLLCLHDGQADAARQALASEAEAGLPRNKTPRFLRIGWDKLRRLQDALECGVPILFADTDIVWLRDPLPLLEAGAADLQLSHDGWGPNIGVMFLRPTACAARFMALWLARADRPDARDQYEFPAAVNATQAECPAFQVQHLNTALWPNGCCCGNAFPADPEAGRRWAMWHAACGGDLRSKRHHLAAVLRASQGL